MCGRRRACPGNISRRVFLPHQGFKSDCQGCKGEQLHKLRAPNCQGGCQWAAVWEGACREVEADALLLQLAQRLLWHHHTAGKPRDLFRGLGWVGRDDVRVWCRLKPSHAARSRGKYCPSRKSLKFIQPRSGQASGHEPLLHEGAWKVRNDQKGKAGAQGSSWGEGALGSGVLHAYTCSAACSPGQASYLNRTGLMPGS